MSDPSSEQPFDQLLHRLNVLERWRELAIRPLPEDCRPEDLDLLEKEADDCRELDRRCRVAREQLNEHLPIYKGGHENDLVARTSSIPGAGLGLFYEPVSNDSVKLAKCIPEGSLLCYYYGHLHNFHSAKLLKDRRYLMMVKGDVLVDPGPLPHIKGTG